MKQYRCDFNNSLVNLSSSILKYYGIEPFHTTLKLLDELLGKKQYDKITVILFDGLNKYIKEQHLKSSDVLIKKVKFNITSVFPPTTAAATTAFLSGKFPIETGWLGWSQHFNNLNVTLDMFSNRISKTDEFYKTKASYEFCPYKTILDLINESNNAKAYSVYPQKINNGEAKDLSNFFDILNNKMKGNSKQFIYAYWTDPDSSIHAEGVHSHHVKDVIKYINKHVARLAKLNPDNLILVIADHGLIDAQYEYITEHKDLYSLLKFDPYLDSRSLLVQVKENKHQEFEDLFNRYYGERYLLLPKQKYLEEQYFGIGKTFDKIDNFLGDYLITALTEKTLVVPDPNGEELIGQHAGSMEEEFVISVAVFND